MSFTAIDTSLPSGDTLAQAMVKINNGMTDTVWEIVLGSVTGYNWSREGANPVEPTAEMWTKGTERLRIEYSYSSGRISTAVYKHSTNSGGAYTTRGTLTYSYDGDGYLTSAVWS